APAPSSGPRRGRGSSSVPRLRSGRYQATTGGLARGVRTGPSSCWTPWAASRACTRSSGSTRSAEAQALRQLGRVAGEADQERAEAAVGGGHLVEAHVVDDVLDGAQVVGQQGHTPLEVVQAGRAGGRLG